MTKTIKCDRCEIKTVFSHNEFEIFNGHKFRKPIFKCPNCGLEFCGDETLA